MTFSSDDVFSLRQFSLQELGWRAEFAQSLTLDDLDAGFPARVAAVHRDRYVLLTERGELEAVLPGRWREDAEAVLPTVGDWVLVEHEQPRLLRVLPRHSLIERMAAGEAAVTQAIAANIDTLFITTSCNADFNPARLERYLAMVRTAGVAPVIVLTKADLAADVAAYEAEVHKLGAELPCVALNATEPAALDALRPWLEAGQTVAFSGSSGVGKSTLVNTLAGRELQATGAIREDDAKGRHTTTGRELVACVHAGEVAWLIDTPGMRELRLGEADAGLEDTFADVLTLAQDCHFRDCQHEAEPGCAVQAAIAAGVLEGRRLLSWRKLLRESAHAREALWQRHAREQKTGRLYKRIQNDKRAQKGNVDLAHRPRDRSDDKG